MLPKTAVLAAALVMLAAPASSTAGMEAEIRIEVGGDGNDPDDPSTGNGTSPSPDDRQDDAGGPRNDAGAEPGDGADQDGAPQDGGQSNEGASGSGGPGAGGSGRFGGSGGPEDGASGGTTDGKATTRDDVDTDGQDNASSASCLHGTMTSEAGHGTTTVVAEVQACTDTEVVLVAVDDGVVASRTASLSQGAHRLALEVPCPATVLLLEGGAETVLEATIVDGLVPLALQADALVVLRLDDACAADACPTVETTALDDGIRLDVAAGAGARQVFRAEGPGGLLPLADLEPGTTTFLDEDVRAGTTYTYIVTGDDPTACPVHEVTAVPALGSPFAAALAMGLGLVALVAARRH